MLLDQGKLCVVEVFSHISDNTGNDGSGDAEPFLPAAAPRPVLDAFEERGLGDVIEDVCNHPAPAASNSFLSQRRC